MTKRKIGKTEECDETSCIEPGSLELSHDALVGLRAALAEVAWKELDTHGIVLLPKLLTTSVATRVARSVAESSNAHLKHKFLTPSCANGENGVYTTLGSPSRGYSLVPQAILQLTDEVADCLREMFGGGTHDLLARLRTGSGGGGHALVMQYAEGGVNYTHRDLPKHDQYQFQLIICLATPGVDFTGGELYVEDAGSSPELAQHASRTALAFEQAGDAIVFRAGPDDAGHNWFHGMQRVTGPADAVRLALSVGCVEGGVNVATHDTTAVVDWSSLPCEAYKDHVAATWEALCKEDPTWKLSANAFNRKVLARLGRPEYMVGQSLRVRLSQARNKLEGEAAQKHKAAPTAGERQKMLDGDLGRISAALQRFIERAR